MTDNKPLQQELISRWDSFLSQIESRFNQSLHQAEEASFELLQASDYDYEQTMQAFMGIKGQIQNLIQKIDATWQQKVRPQMQAAFKNSDWVAEGKKGGELSAKLWVRLRHFELVLEGKLAQIYYDQAIKIAAADFHCSQCSAKLQINKRIFRAQYISCDYCDTVNTFEPETKYTQIGWGIVDSIVNFNLLAQKTALAKSAQTIKAKAQLGKASAQDWQDYKREFLAYYECFFKERIKLNLEHQQNFAADMERKLKEFAKFKQK